MTLDEFVQKYRGVGIDYDGSYGKQCVDLYRVYCKEVLQVPQSPPISGAADIWTTYLTDKFDQFVKVANNGPIKGDIVIWNKKMGNGFGHVAIFLDGETTEFRSLDQNWTPQQCRIETHTYSNMIGWLRLKGGSMTDLQAYLGVTDDQAAKARLKEHLGELNGKCDWGNAEGIRGGFLGSERRNVGNLESQIAVLKTQIEQARAEGYAQGVKDASKPVDKVSLEEYLNLPPELYVTGTIISRR